LRALAAWMRRVNASAKLPAPVRLGIRSSAFRADTTVRLFGGGTTGSGIGSEPFGLKSEIALVRNLVSRRPALSVAGSTPMSLDAEQRLQLGKRLVADRGIVEHRVGHVLDQRCDAGLARGFIRL